MRDISRFGAALAERRRLKDQESDRSAAEARGRLRSCVRLLRKAGCGRVWLAGSLARKRFKPSSDIDLVVEGIDPRLYIRLLTALFRICRPFPVDLIPLEDVRQPSLILSEAEVIYEQA